MADPELLLLDEPAAGLDLGGREDVLRRIAALVRDPRRPLMVLVTHHVEEVPPGFTHAMLHAQGHRARGRPGAGRVHRAEPVPVLRAAADRRAPGPARWTATGSRCADLARASYDRDDAETPRVRPAEALAILAAALAAGGINAVVGSGSLITFPTLLAFGFPPVDRQRVEQRRAGLRQHQRRVRLPARAVRPARRLLRLGVASLAGSLAGAILLLSLPASVFTLIVPALILLACVLVIAPAPAERPGWPRGPRTPSAPRTAGPVLLRGHRSWPVSTAATSARPRACW